MPFDNRHAPLDSPKLTGEPEAPTPGVNDNSRRIANMQVVQALARRPPPAPQTITLTGDLEGRGTLTIKGTVTGIQGRHVTTDVPADRELYYWSQAMYAWELVPACQLGQQSDGTDLVQVSDGAGGFTGVINHVVAGSYPAANVWVDHYGLIQQISSGVLAGTIPDAPRDGFSWGRIDGDWGHVAPLDSPVLTGNPTTPTPPLGDSDTSIVNSAWVKGQNYVTSAAVTDTVAVGLTATGTDRATSLKLNASFNEILDGLPGTGVTLPDYMNIPGRKCRIAAYGTVNLLVYPLDGQTFYYGGVSNDPDQPLLVHVGNVMEVQSATSTKIYMVAST